MASRATLQRKQAALKHLLSDEALLLLPDFKNRMTVLRRLQYIDENAVLRKGRVACEVRELLSLLFLLSAYL